MCGKLLALVLLTWTATAWAQVPLLRGPLDPANQLQTFNEVIQSVNTALAAQRSLQTDAARLTTPYNLYVTTDGDDALNCQAPTRHGNDGPCLTYDHAGAVAAALNADGQTITVNIGAGTFVGNFALNGPTGFATNTTPFGFASMPMIRFKGAGRTLTTIKGAPIVDGLSYCYVLLANQNAALRVTDLSVDASDPTIGTCKQSALYSQFGGTIYVDGDVGFVGATGNLWIGEEKGNLYLSPSCGSCGHPVISGTYGLSGFVVDSQSQVDTDTTLEISGTVTFNGGGVAAGNLVYGVAGGLFKTFAATPITYSGGGNIVGRRYQIFAMSMLHVYHPPFGVEGSEPDQIGSGGRVFDTTLVPCIGGDVGCVETRTANQLGAGGTVTLVANSGLYSGVLQLNPGAGAQAEGFVYFGFPIRWVYATCVGNLAAEDPAAWPWEDTTALQASGLATGGKAFFVWHNGGVNLTPGTPYQISYVCSTTS